MLSPLTTDIEFLLIEYHDSLCSLSKSTSGLRQPNARRELRLEAGARYERTL